MNETVQAFQLGSSTVITIPKKFGIKPGQKLQVEKTGKKIILKEKKMTREKIHKLVESLAGGLNLKKDLTAEELDDLYEESYEKLLH